WALRRQVSPRQPHRQLQAAPLPKRPAGGKSGAQFVSSSSSAFELSSIAIDGHMVCAGQRSGAGLDAVQEVPFTRYLLRSDIELQVAALVGVAPDQFWVAFHEGERHFFRVAAQAAFNAAGGNTLNGEFDTRRLSILHQRVGPGIVAVA